MADQILRGRYAQQVGVFALVEQIDPILRLRHVPYDEIAEWNKADFSSLKKDTADSNSIFEGTRIQP